MSSPREDDDLTQALHALHAEEPLAEGDQEPDPRDELDASAEPEADAADDAEPMADAAADDPMGQGVDDAWAEMQGEVQADIESEAEPDFEIDAEAHAGAAEHPFGSAAYDGEADPTLESEDDLAALSGPGSRTAVRRPPMPRSMDMKVPMIGIFTVIGIALLVPGCWAVGVLMAMDVPMAERPAAKAMAYLMLVSWPIALFLLGAAGVLISQVSRKAAAKRAAAQQGG